MPSSAARLSCKRNRWRAFTVTAGGWVLMFSKLFRVHRTRYKQKCIKVHSDPWLIDRLINLQRYRLLGLLFIKDSTVYDQIYSLSNVKITYRVNIKFLPSCYFKRRSVKAKSDVPEECNFKTFSMNIRIAGGSKSVHGLADEFFSHPLLFLSLFSRQTNGFYRTQMNWHSALTTNISKT